MHRSKRAQRCRAPTGSEHRELTDHVTSRRRRDLLTVDDHRGVALHDHEPVVLRVALMAQLLTLGEVPIGNKLGDVIDLALGAAL